MSLQSYADGICSGRSSCELHVSDLLKTSFKPCPLELSSYLEASFSCLLRYLDLIPFFVIAKLCRWKVFWKGQCQLHVSNLLMTDIKPCPLELSSYFEASFTCINGNVLNSKAPIDFRCFDLQSFADGVCSARTSCLLRVSSLLNTNYQPCPLELSSYLEASSTCVKGRSTSHHILLIE